MFSEAKDILEDIEDFRNGIGEIWGALMYDSGAIVLTNPSFISVLKGLCFLISRDLGVI